MQLGLSVGFAVLAAGFTRCIASTIAVDRGVRRIANARTWKSTLAHVAHWSLPAPPPWHPEDWQEESPVNFASSSGDVAANELRENTTRPAAARCQVERTEFGYINLQSLANSI